MGRKAIEYHRHDVLLITTANASFRAIVEHPGAEPTQESALVSLILRQGSGFAQVKGKTSHAHCGFFNVEKILALGVAGLQGILGQNIFKMDWDPWSRMADIGIVLSSTRVHTPKCRLFRGVRCTSIAIPLPSVALCSCVQPHPTCCTLYDSK